MAATTLEFSFGSEKMKNRFMDIVQAKGFEIVSTQIKSTTSGGWTMIFGDRVEKVKTTHSYYLLIKKELEIWERENLQRLIAELSDGYNPDAFPYILLSVLFSIPFVIVFEYVIKGAGITMTTTTSLITLGVAVLIGKQFAWKVRGNVKASYLERQEKRMSDWLRKWLGEVRI